MSPASVPRENFEGACTWSASHVDGLKVYCTKHSVAESDVFGFPDQLGPPDVSSVMLVSVRLGEMKPNAPICRQIQASHIRTRFSTTPALQLALR